ncbi:alpha/beta fold hydrolase [Micromonospora sp. R77]|nr:alpha/beta fold hydrolase [Micromonospora sp. R77]
MRALSPEQGRRSSTRRGNWTRRCWSRRRSTRPPCRPNRRRCPLLRGLLRRPTRRTAATGATGATGAASVPDLRQRLAGRPGAEQEEILVRPGVPGGRHGAGRGTGQRHRRPVAQRRRLRLADRGGAAQPPRCRDRAAAVAHAGLRPAHPAPDRRHLRAALAADGPALGETATTVGEVDPTETVGALFRDACLAGRTGAGFAFLRGAARLRPTSGAVADLARGLTPVRLSSGEDTPLVCLSSYVARGGVHEYVRLAAEFRGERTVWALPNPGFAPTDPLPADRSTVVDVQSALVAACVGDGPYVLVGASSGGVLAYDVAARQAAAGHPPAALVLIDTYPPTAVESPLNPFRDALVGGMYAREDALARMDFPRLTAMTWYFELFEGWEAGPPPVPTLLVRAASPLPSVAAGTDWRTSWPDAAAMVDVPGDHFTMLETHADTTAQAVRGWVGARPAR